MGWMIFWTILGFYLLGYVLSVRKYAWVIATAMFRDDTRSQDYTRMSGGYKVGGFFISLFAAIIWMILTPIYLINNHETAGRIVSNLLVSPPRESRAVRSRKKRELKLEARENQIRAYENRVRQLEKENAILDQQLERMEAR